MSSWFRTYGFAEVLENLFVGAYPLDADDVRMLKQARVDRVLNLAQDVEYRPGERATVQAAYEAAGISEQRIGLTDYAGLPASELDKAVQVLCQSLGEEGRTYVHCRAGWQRAPAIVAAAIAVREGIGVEQALAYVQQRKPSADPLPHQRADLLRWWAARATTNS